MNEPLAERLRPKKLEDYISQSHLVGKEGVLTQHIKKGNYCLHCLAGFAHGAIVFATCSNFIGKQSCRLFKN